VCFSSFTGLYLYFYYLIFFLNPSDLNYCRCYGFLLYVLQVFAPFVCFPVLMAEHLGAMAAFLLQGAIPDSLPG
jgi:hypothetical protein